MNKLIVITIALATIGLHGCAWRSKEMSHPPQVAPRPITLTNETILDANDGKRIVVHYPSGVDEPVTFFDKGTGQWAASAKVTMPQ